MSEEKQEFEKYLDKDYRRAEQMKIKSEATWVAFIELHGLLNISQFAKEFFNRSQSWFAQKLYEHTVCGKKRKFTKEEYDQIAESFRDIARRLTEYADAIDNAEM